MNDATLVESIIHKKLNGLRPDKNSEFFLCPFNHLEYIISLIIENDYIVNDDVNKTIEEVYNLKQKVFNPNDWITGLPDDIFKEEMSLVICGNVIAKFDVTKATDEQKEAFIKECLTSYKNTIQTPAESIKTIIWKSFQSYLINKLAIPKSHFKASHWKPVVKNCVKDSILIKWRC